MNYDHIVVDAVSTLGALTDTIAREQLGSPAVIVIGDVLRGMAAISQPQALSNAA